MEPEIVEHSFPDGAPNSIDLPSCQSCRRRKLKCSRERPICTHCSRLAVQCVYDTNKNKPGIKIGAVESLNRRVEALEHAVIQLSQHQCDGSRVGLIDDHAIQLPSSYAAITSDSPGFDDAVPCIAAASSTADPVQPACSSQFRRNSPLHAAVGDEGDEGSTRSQQPRKRRRLESSGNLETDAPQPLQALEKTMPPLPALDILRDVITAYFNFIQPWIPILHKTGFRRQLHDPSKRSTIAPILHAMVVAALRLVDNIDQKIPAHQRDAMIETSRNSVLLEAMNSLSLENLQALSIIAFNDIGNGDTHKAWSVVGSLTRTAEYLQLGIEPEHREHEPLLRPLLLLAPCRDWIEGEERRRVFWIIFCLDRFCSVSTGWNTSLTSADVQRRLPADGRFWHKEDAVVTPYFGIWDRSAAKIGNSIAFMPSHYATPDQTTVEGALPTARSAASTQGTIDMSTVGAFAYRVEATESLSRVTTYFLQQKINFKERQELSDWLIRFKELDLRLVHWKMFLPQKWKDSNISRQPTLINMDPNLTLAHITHNTSMILLHQAIAFPHTTWIGFAQLPSRSSADTCQEAAIETCTIMEKYLDYTPKKSLASSQFSFCVFISARVLLVLWRHYQTALAPEFWKLVSGLDKLAQRWAGTSNTQLQCLSGKYARQLRHLHAMCLADPNFSIDVLGYPNMLRLSSLQPGLATDSRLIVSEINSGAHAGGRPPNHEQEGNDAVLMRAPSMQSRLDNTLPTGPESWITGLDDQPAALPPTMQLTPTQHDELSAISNMLMEEQFLSMDRIISFDDMMLTAHTADEALLPWATTDFGYM